MESLGLLEGFKESRDMHNLVFKTFIGDGDSNFNSALLADNSYADLNIVPKKIECYNHLNKRRSMQLQALVKNPSKDYFRDAGYASARRILGSNILKIRQAVDESSARWRLGNGEFNERTANLRREIQSLAGHVFGDHSSCINRNCSNNQPTEDQKKKIEALRKFGIFSKIEKILQDLSYDSESLLHGLTTNTTEQSNNIVCMLFNGKRIFLLILVK